MAKDTNDAKMKDVFISHAWGDKPTVEPLLAALAGAGITYWYDLLELSPGDSLIDGINEGLKRSKIVLFCLSENFLRGNWTPKELNAAFALSNLEDQKVTRLVPLMMTDPADIQRAYPLQFGGKVYIPWDERQIDNAVDQIKKVVSEVDGIGKEYWYAQAHRTYRKGEYVKAALSARKSVDSDPRFFPASVLYVAASLRLDRQMDAYRFIFAKEDDWSTGFDESGVDIDILDYMQDTITREIKGDEIDETGFTFSIIHFLSTETNGNRSWRYLVRLFEKEKFKFHQDTVVFYAGFNGKAEAIAWLRNGPLMSREEKVKERLATLIYIMASKLPTHRDELTEIAKRLAEDDFEDVRAVALPTCYRFAKDGVSIALKALEDRDPMVRMMAFELLAGEHNIEVDDGWMPKETEPTSPADCFGPEIVKRMLNDPDDMVFETAVEMISDGKIECPTGVDLTQVQRPASEEAREAVVKTLAKQDSDEGFQRIMEIALNDPGEFVRYEAIEALEENSRPLPSDYLRRLWEAETISRVKEKLESLVLEKGDENIPDIYLGILTRNMESSYRSEKAFQKLAKTMNGKLIKQAIDLCSEAGKTEISASALQEVIDADLMNDAGIVVQWCLDHGKEESLAILASGRIASIPLKVIDGYRDHSNPILQANALRAIENRLRDGTGLKDLSTLYQTLKPQVLEKDNNSLWASLNAIDGIIEFGTLTEAIELLQDYYEIVNRIFDGKSFPLRAAWERLRILGLTIPHPIYDPEDHSAPYPWPSEGGPYFGIGNKDS